eukprot:TRINITY_DN124_c0_g1_i7.p1 TRINITY_DN124_c0_g1~~TRINITY_DN124_c0_g1_i7.p1  ORF type:complete len:324 (-),score=108.39 TRINITY_DN124_c0_g1_i7:171-1142(-)
MDDLKTKIVKQVEFYFSDSNFPKDKFLRTEAAKDPNGYVQIAVIASFKRMKDLTTDLAVIVDAVKTSGKLEVSEDGQKVRRTEPLPSEDPTLPRSIYAKGFPDDATLESVRDFFSPHGEVLSVRLRKGANRKFKGSVFVEFASEALAKEVAQKDLSLNDQKLVLMTRAQYHEQKRLEKKEKKGQKRGRNEGESGEKNGEQKEKEEAPAKKEHTHGKVIHITNIGPGGEKRQDKVSVNNLKQILGDPKFVDFKAGANEAYARFETPEAAEAAVKALIDNKTQIGGQEVKAEVLDKEKDTEYWAKVQESKGGRKGGKKGGKRRRR